MRKFLLLLFFGLGIHSVLLAQKMSIKGQVLDSASTALPYATVMLLNPNDSSLVNFGTTNTTGLFEIRNMNRADYILKITFVGYKTYSAIISSVGDTDADLGIIKMEVALTRLDELVIEAERAPVVVRHDTIEFNAGSFKTNPNATVEDLLKKLPGVEVDNDGTIRAQGEQVRGVTVDGKNFFGSDPKVATRNLPADAVDKVQVFDKKSDQAVFSGIEDGQRQKTINLELKEEKRNGAFGNIQGGIGTDERYQAKANINRFKKGQQLSFLGMANNINDQGFSIDDYMSFTGGSQQMMRGGQVRLEFNANNQSGIPLNFGGRNNGLMKNYAGGVNFNNEFSKKTELNASYFYNHLDHDLSQNTQRLNILPEGDIRFNQDSHQLNSNSNHRLSTTLDHKIDSLNSLKWTSALTYNETQQNQKSFSETFNPEGDLSNESSGNTTSLGSALNLNTSLLWRHKFGKKGRNLSATVQLTVNDQSREGTQGATNTFYGDQTETQYINQVNSQSTENIMYSGMVSYTEPLGKRKYLEGNYTFRQNLNTVDKQVFDVVNEDEIFNQLLSNKYNSDYQYHRAGLNFRMNRPKYNLTIGSSLQQTYLEGELELIDQPVSKSYQNILPAAHFNYDFSNTRHLRFDYETSVQEPSIQELQPVIDNSDQLNWYVGNPGLRPAYEHNGRVNFTTFDPATFINFFAFLEASYTRDAIVTSQSYTADNVRLSMPVNVDQSTRISGDATFGFPIQKIGSRLSFSVSITRENGLNVIEGEEAGIIQQTLGARSRYEFRYKEVFNASLSAIVNRQSTEYEISDQGNQLFFNKTLNAEVSLSFLKNYQLTSSLEYLMYDDKKNNYDQTIPLANISFSRFLLKAKSGELRVSVNNLLDKSLGISQSADVNFVERVTANSLGRYYMVSFIYALNRQLNPMGMRPGGNMIRIMR
ncbi:MAG TPA: outer membrane beta-barrel protein [Ohtaekwangia sp.]